MQYEKLVPDFSVLIEGLLSDKIESKEISCKEIIIHEALLNEIEKLAKENKVKGYLGLDEIEKLSKLSQKLDFQFRFSGPVPRFDESLERYIRNLAYDENAVLITTSNTVARFAESKGIQVLSIDLDVKQKSLKIEKYFDELTMSVHLKENVAPYAKKGKPGDWKFTFLTKELLSADYIRIIASEIIEEAEVRKDGFVEIERPGSTIVQLGHYRIVITRPPFSDGWEITAVRPVKILSLEDYNLTENLRERIAVQAEGILIAGAPGMGKSTFAQALATYYADQNRTVKTIEAPRDLILKENITQYAVSHGDLEEIHDILLLSRPDNTLFDEMRNTPDFKLFTDLRLAGIGLAGVVHATNPIDAVQRFVGRIELGVIPHVIDTVIFIKDGKIAKVLSLEMKVKVPSGMTEADLARPVVVVTDFETHKLEFEMYKFGEETVVVPVQKRVKGGLHSLAEQRIAEKFRKLSQVVKVNVVSDNKAVVYVPEQNISKIIGAKGKNIDSIEKTLGISIDVEPLVQEIPSKSVPFEFDIGKKNIKLFVEPELVNRDVDVYVHGDYLLTAKVGKNAVVRLKRAHKIGKLISDALNEGKGLELRIKS